MKLIVTRPREQAAPWVTQLRALGVQAQALPLIRIERLADVAPLRSAWSRLGDYTLVFFVSANAVQAFFEAAASVRDTAPPAWPDGVWAGSPGPGTTTALRAAGVPPGQTAEPDPTTGPFDSEGLWVQLQSRDWNGRRVLVVRGEDGRDWLADTLRGCGAEVDFIAAYRRGPPRLETAEWTLLDEALSEPARHLWHFSSSEAIGHLAAVAARRSAAADWSHSRAIASHPRIVQAAREAGFGDVQQVRPDLHAVAAWCADPAAGAGHAGPT